MRKRMLAVLLPVAAGVALAGTGFGAWIFAGTVNTAVTGANIELTDAYGYSGLAVEWTDGKKTLKLDQNDTHNGGKAIEDLEFTVSYTAQVEAGGTGTYTDGETDDKDSYSFKPNTVAAKNFGYTVEVTKNTLSDYVTPTFSVKTGSTGTGTAGAPMTVTDSVSASTPVKDTIVVSFVWKNAPTAIDGTNGDTYNYAGLKALINTTTPPLTFTVTMAALS